MSRISLRETYDNRSVIAQIAKVTDTAEDAAETVQQKAAEINDALTDVNAAVQAAEGAVTTANAASASAQQSAQTVAGYNTRLTTAEGEINTLQSDLNSVTLRVQTAEGNIVTIQGRVTALETADGQNVKINAINDYAVGLTGNQNFTGQKRATTQNGLSMITLANNSNSFEIGSSGFYNRIKSRSYTSDGTEYDEHFEIGTVYATGNSCVMRMLAYAPRSNKGDNTEGQTAAGIAITVNNDDTISVRLSAYKKDGTNVNKTLGTFDGTNWS